MIDRRRAQLASLAKSLGVRLSEYGSIGAVSARDSEAQLGNFRERARPRMDWDCECPSCQRYARKGRID